MIMATYKKPLRPTLIIRDTIPEMQFHEGEPEELPVLEPLTLTDVRVRFPKAYRRITDIPFFDVPVQFFIDTNGNLCVETEHEESGPECMFDDERGEWLKTR